MPSFTWWTKQVLTFVACRDPHKMRTGKMIKQRSYLIESLYIFGNIPLVPFIFKHGGKFLRRNFPIWIIFLLYFYFSLLGLKQNIWYNIINVWLASCGTTTSQEWGLGSQKFWRRVMNFFSFMFHELRGVVQCSTQGKEVYKWGKGHWVKHYW